MDREIVELHHAYTRGSLDRREFLQRLAVLAGGMTAACAMLPLLDPEMAQAGMVPESDARLDSEYIEYPGPAGGVRAYLTRLKGGPRRPGVVVAHENRGLNPHIEDVGRRLALEGFLALAPDALSSAGGTPEDPDTARDMIKKLDPETTVQNFVAAVKYLKTHPQASGKVGIVGFCWGGAMANQVAVRSPDLDAAVPYYGRQPKDGDVPEIKAPLLLHYAGLDERINKGIPAFEAALKKVSADYRLCMYPGAKHAFNNDTNAGRYHEEAARLAWKRTVAFLKEKLRE